MDLTELKYRIDRFFRLHVDSAVRRLMPKYIVTQALLKSSHFIRPDEEVPAVPFMAVYERQFKSDINA